MTLTEKIVDYIQSTGYKEVPSKSRKYRKFLAPSDNIPLWVGKSGAVRRGFNITTSLSLSSYYKIKAEIYHNR